MFARRWWPCAGVLIGLFGLPLESWGGVLTFAFEGHITQKRDTLGLLSFASEGDKVIYTFSFEQDATDYAPGQDLGAYLGTTASLRIANTEVSCGTPSIVISHPRDSFEISSSMAPQHPGLRSDGLSIFTLTDQAESNALASAALPEEPYDLAPFASKYFMLWFYLLTPPPPGSEVQLDLSGEIDTMYLVPEPSMLIFGVASLVVLARRNRQYS